MKKHYDVIIIGAGPAGSVAAAKLIKEGKTVLVIEKMKFPRFVIGESLLPHCMDFLDELDLIPCIEKEKFQPKTGVCFYHDDEICDFLFDDQFTKDSWQYTWQVKRAKFDNALISEVEKRGATVYFETEVVNVEMGEKEHTVTYNHPEQGMQEATCKFVLDASGYGRVLPKMFDLEVPVVTPPRGAIFAHVQDQKRSEKASENIFVHAFNDNTAWIWSIPFSDGTTSVGIVGNADFVKECHEDNSKLFDQLLGDFPGMDERYKNVPKLFEPKVILNYAVSVKKLYGEGYALCGNATEFLDPVFSSGVTFAISSGALSADLVVRQLNGETVDWEQEYSVRMKAGIDVFRTYVNAWYDGTLATIFYAKNRNEEFMRQICSVLAGYVWDLSNPFVKKHKTILTALAKVIKLQETELNKNTISEHKL